MYFFAAAQVCAEVEGAEDAGVGGQSRARSSHGGTGSLASAMGTKDERTNDARAACVPRATKTACKGVLQSGHMS